jgi:hypothetical protein
MVHMTLSQVNWKKRKRELIFPPAKKIRPTVLQCSVMLYSMLSKQRIEFLLRRVERKQGNSGKMA